MIGVKKIAHATYETPDLDKQIEYYTDILGLNLIAKEKDAAFLASTSHTPGWNGWRRPTPTDTLLGGRR